ncbi:MAG: TolC family protein [Holophagaceae bacterium]|uniref:TolC family protein n=1 Tax=Candidatus Geothrix skivensis TaxID=2954439 RepID=A0A9D7SEA2_9BACT|nr:TolC family protein [Candidatus Geothrix skivensis]
MADPALREAARTEARFHLRRAYLDAWLSERLLQLREADLATVESWLKAARARLEAGGRSGVPGQPGGRRGSPCPG